MPADPNCESSVIHGAGTASLPMYSRRRRLGSGWPLKRLYAAFGRERSGNARGPVRAGGSGLPKEGPPSFYSSELSKLAALELAHPAR